MRLNMKFIILFVFLTFCYSISTETNVTLAETIPIVKVTTSQETEEHPASHTIDNNLGTYWLSTGDQWIQLDLGAETTISQVSIAFLKGAYVQTLFDIELSTDQSSWVNVFSGSSSGATAAPESFTISETLARYVRVACHGNTGNQFNYINEISIDGNTIEPVVMSPVNFGLKSSQSIIDATTPPSSRNEILSQVSGNTYYLDQINGDDNNIGTQASPWKTLSKAQSSAISGDCIILKSGDYGAYEEANVSGRNGYILYIAEDNAVVHFDTISITNTSLMDTYLIFHGINVQPDWVDPASSGQPGSEDPQYLDSTLRTYAQTLSVASLNNAKYVQIINTLLTGTNKHLTPYSVIITNSQNITIESCNMSKVHRGVGMLGSTDVNILYNHIHEITSSAIMQGDTQNYNVLIEGNHAHNAKYSVSEDYAPRVEGEEYHGSGVAVRNGSITIRNNIFHDGFPSSGIMTYDADIGGLPQFDNVTIENNLLYDIHVTYVLRIYAMGDNFVVRNNTFIGSYRTGNDGRYRYNTVLTIHTIASNGSPHADISNNLFVGIFNVGDFTENVTKNNNISWSFAHVLTFYCEDSSEAGTTNSVMTCGYSDNPEQEILELFNGSNLTFAPLHDLTLDFTPSQHSKALNYGDPTNQPNDSLGSIDTQGFVENNGHPRSADVHNAGAY